MTGECNGGGWRRGRMQVPASPKRATDWSRSSPACDDEYDIPFVFTHHTHLKTHPLSHCMPSFISEGELGSWCSAPAAL